MRQCDKPVKSTEYILSVHITEHILVKNIYFGSPINDARDYDKLQKALLQRYNFTEQKCRERFTRAKPKGQESLGQLIVRILIDFNKWMELFEVGKMFEGVKELMVQENSPTHIRGTYLCS